MILIMMFCLLIAIISLVYFMIKNKNIWEQILGMNSITSLIVMIILLYTLYSGVHFYIDTAIIYALLGIVGTLFIVLYVYKRGDI